jgi:hypothetical protein
MKALCVLLLAAVLGAPAAAQTNLAGTWQGELQPTPDTKIRIHFVITARPGAQYGVVVTSPDSGAIKDVAATNVTFADNRLSIDVPELSGGYAGILRDGVIEGEWSQEGSKLPLDLRPFETPVLTPADIEALRGEWVGKLSPAPELALTLVLRFSTAEDGTFRAVLDSPDQNTRDLPVTDVALDDGQVSLKVPAVRGEFAGRLAGDEIVGQWSQLGRSLPLTVKKGQYIAQAAYLDLPAAVRTQLAGRWTGMVGPLSAVFRFETDAQGRTLGFLDVAAQGASGIPITEASFADGTIRLRVASVGGQLSGTLAGSRITGEWTQLGMTTPVTLARE